MSKVTYSCLFSQLLLNLKVTMYCGTAGDLVTAASLVSAGASHATSYSDMLHPSCMGAILLQTIIVHLGAGQIISRCHNGFPADNEDCRIDQLATLLQRVSALFDKL